MKRVLLAFFVILLLVSPLTVLTEVNASDVEDEDEIDDGIGGHEGTYQITENDEKQTKCIRVDNFTGNQDYFVDYIFREKNDYYKADCLNYTMLFFKTGGIRIIKAGYFFQYKYTSRYNSSHLCDNKSLRMNFTDYYIEFIMENDTVKSYTHLESYQNVSFVVMSTNMNVTGGSNLTLSTKNVSFDFEQIVAIDDDLTEFDGWYDVHYFVNDTERQNMTLVNITVNYTNPTFPVIIDPFIKVQETEDIFDPFRDFRFWEGDQHVITTRDDDTFMLVHVYNSTGNGSLSVILKKKLGSSFSEGKTVSELHGEKISDVTTVATYSMFYNEHNGLIYIFVNFMNTFFNVSVGDLYIRIYDPYLDTLSLPYLAYEMELTEERDVIPYASDMVVNDDGVPVVGIGLNVRLYDNTGFVVQYYESALTEFYNISNPNGSLYLSRLSLGQHSGGIVVSGLYPPFQFEYSEGVYYFMSTFKDLPEWDFDEGEILARERYLVYSESEDCIDWNVIPTKEYSNDYLGDVFPASLSYYPHEKNFDENYVMFGARYPILYNFETNVIEDLDLIFQNITQEEYIELSEPDVVHGFPPKIHLALNFETVQWFDNDTCVIKQYFVGDDEDDETQHAYFWYVDVPSKTGVFYYQEYFDTVDYSDIVKPVHMITENYFSIVRYRSYVAPPSVEVHSDLYYYEFNGSGLEVQFLRDTRTEFPYPEADYINPQPFYQLDNGSLLMWNSWFIDQWYYSDYLTVYNPVTNTSYNVTAPLDEEGNWTMEFTGTNVKAGYWRWREFGDKIMFYSSFLNIWNETMENTTSVSGFVYSVTDNQITYINNPVLPLSFYFPMAVNDGDIYIATSAVNYWAMIDPSWQSSDGWYGIYHFNIDDGAYRWDDSSIDIIDVDVINIGWMTRVHMYDDNTLIGAYKISEDPYGDDDRVIAMFNIDNQTAYVDSSLPYPFGHFTYSMDYDRGFLLMRESVTLAPLPIYSFGKVSNTMKIYSLDSEIYSVDTWDMAAYGGQVNVATLSIDEDSYLLNNTKIYKGNTYRTSITERPSEGIDGLNETVYDYEAFIYNYGTNFFILLMNITENYLGGLEPPLNYQEMFVEEYYSYDAGFSWDALERPFEFGGIATNPYFTTRGGVQNIHVTKNNNAQEFEINFETTQYENFTWNETSEMWEFDNETDLYISYYVSMPLKTYSVSLSLEKGWNLIGMPLDVSRTSLEMMDSDIRAVTSKNDGEFVTVVDGYDVGRDFSMEFGKGYYIFARNETTLNLTGQYPKDTLLYWNVGWNLAGIPFDVSVTVSYISEKTNSSLSYIQGGAYVDYIHPVGGIDSTLEAGKGVFIYSQTEQTIIPTFNFDYGGIEYKIINLED